MKKQDLSTLYVMVFIAMLGGCNSCEKLDDQDKKIERLEQKIEDQHKMLDEQNKKIDKLLEIKCQ